MTPVPMVVRLRAQNQCSGIATKRSARWTVHKRFSQSQKGIRLQNGSNRSRTDQTSSSIQGSSPSISSQGKEDVRSIHLLSIRSRHRRLPPNAFRHKFTEDRLRYPSIGSLDGTTISLRLNKSRHIEGSKRRDMLPFFVTQGTVMISFRNRFSSTISGIFEKICSLAKMRSSLVVNDVPRSFSLRQPKRKSHLVPGLSDNVDKVLCGLVRIRSFLKTVANCKLVHCQDARE
jgi:hypothetical protein